MDGGRRQGAPRKGGGGGATPCGVSLKIVDPDGTAVAPGEVGELLVRPPNMASGYASGAELSDRIDEEGYLATGDLGRLDEDGFVWIEGRVGRPHQPWGNKVFPDEVEEVLCLSPLVAEAAVVGVPDDRLGEVPVAFVVTTGDVGDDELIALCRDHLTPYKIPLDFVRVDALPKNEIGKVLRRQLSAGYTR